MNRYEKDLHDDAKSGYRSVSLTRKQVEWTIINTLLTRGGQPLHQLMDASLLQGTTGIACIIAVGRLEEQGRIHFDGITYLVTYNAPKHLPWYRRLFQGASVHPASVLILCVFGTAIGCGIWAAIRNACLVVQS